MYVTGKVTKQRIFNLQSLSAIAQPRHLRCTKPLVIGTLLAAAAQLCGPFAGARLVAFCLDELPPSDILDVTAAALALKAVGAIVGYYIITAVGEDTTKVRELTVDMVESTMAAHVAAGGKRAASTQVRPGLLLRSQVLPLWQES
jgi:hypothetical protein